MFNFNLQLFATISNSAANTIITANDDDLDDQDNVTNTGLSYRIPVGVKFEF